MKKMSLAALGACIALSTAYAQTPTPTPSATSSSLADAQQICLRHLNLPVGQKFPQPNTVGKYEPAFASYCTGIDTQVAASAAAALATQQASDLAAIKAITGQ